jgi:hypothetical protein
MIITYELFSVIIIIKLFSIIIIHGLNSIIINCYYSSISVFYFKLYTYSLIYRSKFSFLISDF